MFYFYHFPGEEEIFNDFDAIPDDDVKPPKSKKQRREDDSFEALIGDVDEAQGDVSGTDGNGDDDVDDVDEEVDEEGDEEGDDNVDGNESDSSQPLANTTNGKVPPPFASS